jgi:hypothetical protein
MRRLRRELQRQFCSNSGSLLRLQELKKLAQADFSDTQFEAQTPS